MRRRLLKKVGASLEKVGQELQLLANEIKKEAHKSRKPSRKAPAAIPAAQTREDEIRAWPSWTAVVYIQHGMCSPEDLAVLRADLPRRLTDQPDDPDHLALELELRSNRGGP